MVTIHLKKKKAILNIFRVLSAGDQCVTLKIKYISVAFLKLYSICSSSDNGSFFISTRVFTCRISSRPRTAVLTSSIADSAVGSRSGISRDPEHTRERLATCTEKGGGGRKISLKLKHTLLKLLYGCDWSERVLVQWCPASWWSDVCCSPQPDPQVVE